MQNAFSFAMGFLVVSLISASAYFYFDPEKLTPTFTDLPSEDITANVSNSDTISSENATGTVSSSTTTATTTIDTASSTSNN